MTVAALEKRGRNAGCVLVVPYTVNEQKETLIFDFRGSGLVGSAASGPSKKRED